MDTSIATTAHTLSAKMTARENVTGQPRSRRRVPPSGNAFDKEWQRMLRTGDLTPSKSGMPVDRSKADANHEAVSDAPESAVPVNEDIDGAKDGSKLGFAKNSLAQASISGSVSPCDLSAAQEVTHSAPSEVESVEKKGSLPPKSEERRPHVSSEVIGSIPMPGADPAHAILSIEKDAATSVPGTTSFDNIQQALVAPASMSPSRISWTDQSTVLATPQSQALASVTTSATGFASTVLTELPTLDLGVAPKEQPGTGAPRKVTADPNVPCREDMLPASTPVLHQSAGAIPVFVPQTTPAAPSNTVSIAIDAKIGACRVEAPPMFEHQPRISAVSPKLDVGVFDDVHGWLHIRAELDANGNVNASLTTASATAHDSLRAKLPELVSYLTLERVNVSSLAIHQSAPVAHGLAANTEGQQDEQPAQQPQHEGGREPDVERRPPTDEPSRAAVLVAEQASKETLREWVGGIARVTAELTWPIGNAGRGQGGWVNVCA